MAGIEYSTRAADWLRDAEPDVRERVMDRLERAAEFPDHFPTRLANSPHYKLRAGDYRAIVDWRRGGEEDESFVREIGHRDRIYD